MTQFPHRVEAACTVWKNAKFTLTEKIFRQINSLVISLVKSLFSRNFCQKSVRENFRNFHTVRFIFQHGLLNKLEGRIF